MEIEHMVDQRRSEVERFLTEHGEVLAKQGAVVETYRRRGARRLGPYYKLTCRVGGRQESVYLGTDTGFVEGVRTKLKQLRRANAERALFASIRRALRRAAKSAYLRLDEELLSRGLRRQGHELRGWRSASAMKGIEIFDSARRLSDESSA